jgi:hypothetical protein
MLDPHHTTGPTAAPSREADAECRGIGAPRDPAGNTCVGASVTTRVSVPADGPVERPVVREAVHTRVRLAAAEPFGEPSPELVRLLGHLQSTVTRFVHERREAGAAVERVIPEVKGLVREAASCEGWVDPADTLTAQVVRWTITAYHDEPELAHGPLFY